MRKSLAVLVGGALLAGCAVPAEESRTASDRQVAEIAAEQQRLSKRIDDMAKVLVDIREKLDSKREPPPPPQPTPEGPGKATEVPGVMVEDVTPPKAEQVKVVTEPVKVEPPPQEPPRAEPPKAPPVEVKPEAAQPVPAEKPTIVIKVVEPAPELKPEAAPAEKTAAKVEAGAEAKEAGKPEAGGQGKPVGSAEREKLLPTPERRHDIALPKGEDPASKLFRSAFGHYESGDFGRAILDFEEFALNNPGSELTDSALFLIGDSYFRSGQFEQAIVEYNRVVERFPAGRQAPEALYMIGECFDRLGQGERAKVFYARLTESYPASEASGRAKRKSGNP